MFFNEEPIPYSERGTWLLDADCVLSTHLDHLEASFSFRTRLLDCFWAGVPAVCTGGDELSELIQACDGGWPRPTGTSRRWRTGSSRCWIGARAAYRERLQRPAGR